MKCEKCGNPAILFYDYCEDCQERIDSAEYAVELRKYAESLCDDPRSRLAIKRDGHDE